MKAFIPPKYEAADATAIQQLERGEASPEMQKRALKWIINEVCRTYDQSYRPGLEGARETDFAEGKRYVGLHIVTMLKVDPSKLRREE